MENSITRIADLPDNIIIQNKDSMGRDGGGGGGSTMDMNYNPINIHPNPYGNQSPNPTIIPVPQQTSSPNRINIHNNPSSNVFQKSNDQINIGISDTTSTTNINDLQGQQYIQQYPQQQQQVQQQHHQQINEEQLIHMQNQRLPSRDIPRIQIMYTNDEQITPNYLPQSKSKTDFVKDTENDTEEKLQEHENKKKRKNKLNDLINEFQIPIFIGILFFIFQMPIVNNLVFKKLSFLSITNPDGNFNVSGLLMKSMLFGSFYYFVLYIVHLITDLS